VVVYSSFLGGALADVVTAVKVDSAGKVYVYGYTNNGDLVATIGLTRPPPPAKPTFS